MLQNYSDDPYRQSLELEINNQKIAILKVYDGTSLWMHINNETKALNDAKVVAEFAEGSHALRVVALYKLGKEFSLSSLGEVKVKDKVAAGVRLSHKGQRDVNLYFDKDKHRLVKAEYQAIDPITKKEVNREEFYSGHKAVDGIVTPHQLIVHHDGVLFMELELSDVRYRERHEEGTFTKP